MRKESICMRKTKPIFAVIGAAILLPLCTACQDSSSVSSTSAHSESSLADPVTPAVSGAADPLKTPEAVETEEAVVPKTGDAFLYLSDETCLLNYDGTADSMLCYAAVCPTVEKNGSYTVSVNADTAGARLAAAGDVSGSQAAKGLSFAAVAVKGAAAEHPEMCIEITAVRVDGKPLPLNTPNYTYNDPDGNVRADIYSTWQQTMPENARTAAANRDACTAKIIAADAFTNWKTVSVDFNVTGMKE